MVVEDGTGLADADALVSVEFCDAYHAARGNATWSGLSTADKEVAIIRGTDYFELVYGQRLRNVQKVETQALSLPMLNDEMPAKLLRAVCVIAFHSTTVNLFSKPTTDDDGNAVVPRGPVLEVSETVDVIKETTKYAEPQSSDSFALSHAVLAEVDMLAAPFINTRQQRAMR